MMYQTSIGIKYTAKKSSTPRSSRLRLGPITFKLYPSPRRLKIVDFTCTRKNRPRYSTPTSYLAQSPCGLKTLTPSSAARAIKHSSAPLPAFLAPLQPASPHLLSIFLHVVFFRILIFFRVLAFFHILVFLHVVFPHEFGPSLSSVFVPAPSPK